MILAWSITLSNILQCLLAFVCGVVLHSASVNGLLKVDAVLLLELAESCRYVGRLKNMCSCTCMEPMISIIIIVDIVQSKIFGLQFRKLTLVLHILLDNANNDVNLLVALSLWNSFGLCEQLIFSDVAKYL